MNENRLISELEELKERIDILYRKTNLCVYKLIRSKENNVEAEYRFITNGGECEYSVAQSGGGGDITLLIDGINVDSGRAYIGGVVRLAKGRHEFRLIYSGEGAAEVLVIRLCAPCLKEI